MWALSRGLSASEWASRNGLIFLAILAFPLLVLNGVRQFESPDSRFSVSRFAKNVPAVLLCAFLASPKSFERALLQEVWFQVSLFILTILAAVIFLTDGMAGWRRARHSGKRGSALYLEALAAMMPRPLANLMVTEFAILRTALFQWREEDDLGHSDAVKYYYHRDGMNVKIILLFIGMSFIEIPLVSFLLHKWNATLSLVVADVSVIGAIYLVGVVKSLLWRPVLLSPDALVVRLGDIRELAIPIKILISATKISSKTKDRSTIRAYLFDEPNIRVSYAVDLGDEHRHLDIMQMSSIEFRVDQPKEFLAALSLELAASGNK